MRGELPWGEPYQSAVTDASQAESQTAINPERVQKPHLAARIAGGAARIPGLQVYAKSGTWGPIYADAGIVRDPSGRQFALAVFTQGNPPYRGDFIAELTYRAAAHLLKNREEKPRMNSEDRG